MSYITVDTSVDVYMSDFEDDELVEELEERGYIVHKAHSDEAEEIDDIQAELRKLVYFYRSSSAERYMELSRPILEELTGKILP